MEAKKASIQRGDSQVSLVLNVNERDLKILLTDDNPSNVKGVFNELLKELKKGELNFELDDNSEDLYHHICIEYINQLNAELDSIYQELSDFELLDTP